MQFQIRNRWSGEVQITAEIECPEDTPYSIKLGLAVKWAIKSRANLSDADLRGADLSGADLSRAYLSGADLSGAYLSGADLSRAYLSGADLSGAYLSRANLSDANLSDADLSGADLSGADLSRAYLSGADLSDAYLSRAYLSRAYLSGADLSDADLSGADLSGAENIPDNAPVGPGSLTLKQFRDDIVPSLLTATGKTIPDVLATGCWDCHSWDNCPMHVVFNVRDTADVPVIWRPYAEMFVRLFDARQLPKPAI